MFEIVAAGVSVAGTAVCGLIAWGLKAEMRAVRADVRAGLAEAEIRFYQRVNGSYVRKDMHGDLVARVDRVENRVEALE